MIFDYMEKMSQMNGALNGRCARVAQLNGMKTLCLHLLPGAGCPIQAFCWLEWGSSGNVPVGLSSRFWDSSKARVAPQQQIARVKRLHLEARAVTRDAERVSDLVAQQLNRADGREFAPESQISGVGDFR